MLSVPLTFRHRLLITPLNQHTWGQNACWYAAALMVLDGVRHNPGCGNPMLKGYHPLENAWLEKMARQSMLRDAYILRFMQFFGFESRYYKLGGDDIYRALVNKGPLMYPSGRDGVRHFYVIGGVARDSGGNVSVDVLNPAYGNRKNDMDLTGFVLQAKPSYPRADNAFLAMHLSKKQSVPHGLDPKAPEKQKLLAEMFGA